MISPPITLLLLFLFQTLAFAATATTFSFPSFSFRNLTLLGDSFLHNGSIGLTRETAVPSSSSGTAIYNLPIQFHDPRSNLSASFSTNFTFSITNLIPDAPSGDGLTFFISPFNFTLGAAGGYLGLFNFSSQVKNGSVFAVEFDTKLDEEFGDPNGNHVGLDINSPKSVKVADLGTFDVELKNGNPIMVWIDYYQHDESLKIWLGNSEIKPETPVLSTRFDLSNCFAEYMYVGFSASTEGSTDVHTIEGWSFETFGFPVLNPSAEMPHNVSENSISMIPAIPSNNSVNSSHKNLSFGLRILGPVSLAVLFGVLIWVSVKKQIVIKDCKEGTKQEFLKGPRKFIYKELSSSTKGFHSSRVIGNGAFGTVYKAIDLRSGLTYAVKRSKQAHESQTEFAGELSIIAGLRHKNLVQLQGWCTEKDELLLVYELMPNGSLDKVLYPPTEMGPYPILTWVQRYNVCMGIASVLSYLHQECDQRVIHRDIKASNIMLDADFNPRLGDFGLARLMDHNESPVSTLTAGTMGYLAPEYLQFGKCTEKTDVFSYGVVVLEVCCGRRPIEKVQEGKDHSLVNLVDWVWSLYSEDRLIHAVDKRLNGEFDEKEMLRLLLVGLSCVNPNCEERPSMRRVLQILNHEAMPLAVPRVKPLLFFTSSALSLKEIVSDCEESATSSSLYEVKID